MARTQGNLAKCLRLLLVSITLLAMLLTASACNDKKSGKSADAATSAPTEAPVPTELKVSSVYTHVGTKNVEVTVELTGNPGILGMDFDISYDDKVMRLTDARSEVDAPGYTFTPPAYFRNPTTFLWDFEAVDWTTDGKLLTLHFDIAEDAAPGQYEVKLLYSYGNIFDNSGEPINVDVTNAYITVVE